MSSQHIFVKKWEKYADTPSYLEPSYILWVFNKIALLRQLKRKQIRRSCKKFCH